MADANITVTIDTASSPWVKLDGKTTTVNGVAEDFVLRLLDLGTTAIYEGGGGSNDNTIALSDGSNVTICKDKRFVHLGPFSDGVALGNAGSIWISEDNSSEVEVKVVTATIADADSTGANNITTITFEYPGKPYRWTWTNIKTA